MTSLCYFVLEGERPLRHVATKLERYFVFRLVYSRCYNLDMTASGLSSVDVPFAVKIGRAKPRSYLQP